ncbi:hypothetical protein ACU686_18685 [Yinghuangia aomiensis]
MAAFGNIYDDMKKGGSSKELQDFYAHHERLPVPHCRNGLHDGRRASGRPGPGRHHKRYNWGNPEGGTPRNDIEGVPQNDLARLNETSLAHD